MRDSPWVSNRPRQIPGKTVAERYEVGKEISGEITNLTDFGVFVELEEGIEGLVHVSEISKENVKNPKEHYQIGETITAKVMNINSDERRIGLSIKRLEEDDDRQIPGRVCQECQACYLLFW